MQMLAKPTDAHGFGNMSQNLFWIIVVDVFVAISARCPIGNLSIVLQKERSHATFILLAHASFFYADGKPLGLAILFIWPSRV